MLSSVTAGVVENDRPQPAEVFSLNQANLDVEELERRLELASTLPNAGCWDLTSCPTDCKLASPIFGGQW